MNRGHLLYSLWVLASLTCTPFRTLSAASLAAAFEHAAYAEFEHISVGVEAPFVLGIFQDMSGLMWICTHKGLYSYDGYRAIPHLSSEIPIQTHCATQIGNQIWVGSDHGVMVYDLQSRQYVENSATAREEGRGYSVRAILPSGNTVWIGDQAGIIRYDMGVDRVERISLSDGNGPSLGAYSIHEDTSGLYVGSFDGLYRFDRDTRRFSRLGPGLPDEKSDNPIFVYSICKDALRHCLWLGTQHGLWRYDPDTGTFLQEQELPNMVINSITIDRSGSIVIGSDAGLFVYDGRTMQHITHDARNNTSLSDDDIESLLTDRDGNIWIGTHDGISLARSRQAWEIAPLRMFTTEGRGLMPSSILKDRSGGLWLGGTNGIIYLRNDGSVEQHHIHNTSHPLPHNSIHSIYEDPDGVIWAATDGGIVHYDRAAGRFRAYPMQSDLYNAQWCHAVTEDLNGRIWIGTFSSGIFIYDRERLLRESGGMPDKHLLREIRNGQVFRMQTDPQGHVWVLYYDHGIDRIAPDGTVAHFDLARYIGTEIIPTDMTLDNDGFLWAGFRGGALRIDTRTEEAVRIDFSERYDGEILTVGTAPDAVWFSTTDGLVWSIDRKTLHPVLIPLPVRRYPSLCYDDSEQAMLLGCSDAIMRVKLPLPHPLRPMRKPQLTDISVNGQTYQPTDRKGNPHSIDYSSKITLKNPKRFTLYFSAMNFAQGGSDKYAYRLEPTQEEWVALTSGVSSVSFLDLQPGSYRFSVCLLDATGSPAPDEAVRTLDIVVRPPLWASAGAWALYSLLLLAIAAYVVYSIRLRIRLRQMHFEKETLLAQSSSKIAFLANISHDLKTPLSLIIGPVSQIMLSVRDKTLHAQLDAVRRNAERINSLVSQILDFKDGDADDDHCILSTIDLREVFLQVIDRYRQQADIRKIETRVHTDNAHLFYPCDLHKMESVFDNLLSNAYKYVPDGGTVDLSLTADPQAGKIVIRIADNGIGIPESEQPYIFQRFFQSSLTRARKGGTGIGLYLVHKYVTLHGGTVRAESREGEGSLFTIELPLQNGLLPLAETESASSPETSGKPLVLIAEDDLELSSYIAETLAPIATPLMAANGQEALALFHREAPALIVTDLMMPGIDGMEFCRRIRSEEVGRTVPVIMLTARADAGTETESLRLNIDAFMAKPFDTHRLFLRVRQLLAAHGTHSATAAPADNAPSPDELFLARVTSFIESAIDSSELNVQQISDAMGVSSKQLYRKVKALTGYTPVDYIRSIRIKRAAIMLASGHFTVSETMYSVGFSDSSYFARCFRTEFGCTPSQYRKEQEDKK